METPEESSLAVQRVFGREPLIEDWRCVGRWAYAAAWLASNRPTARELVRARMIGATALATRMAMASGKGSNERFALVSALARLPEAFLHGEGPYAEAADRAIHESAEALLRDGIELRAATARERAAFTPRFHLEGFDIALREVGPDRHVYLRENASGLETALGAVHDPCPSLRVLRRFMQATLAFDVHDALSVLEAATATEGMGVVAQYGLWLTADLALTARRGAMYAAAWTAASRVKGDSLSRALSWLASGSTLQRDVVRAFEEDPWALPLALAMTSEQEHAVALLDCAVQSQGELARRAKAEAEAWAAQSRRVDELERRLGIEIDAEAEVRTGHLEISGKAMADLYTAWNALQIAQESRARLRSAVDRCLAAEERRRRAEVSRAQGALEAARSAHEATLQAGQAALAEHLEREREELIPGGEENAQRGCVYGFGAGCSVMATYAVLGIFLGTGGALGKIKPVVVGIAALPVVAAIVVQVAYALRRMAAEAEVARRKAKADAAYVRARQLADEKHGLALKEGRKLLESAEASLHEFERHASKAEVARAA